MSAFDEAGFRAKVDEALEKVRKILDTTRDPKLPADVPHKYDDKYALAEYLTKTTLAAQLNVLEALGVNGDQLHQMIEWAKTKSVTIRLKVEERCTLNRKEKKKIESAIAHVSEVKVGSLKVAKLTDKSYTKVFNYFWDFSVNYAIFAYQGTDVDKPLVFQGRSGSCEVVVQNNESPPFPEVVVRPSLEFNVSWLLQHLRNGQMDFKINRAAKSCRTPRRNEDISTAFAQCGLFHDWCEKISRYFVSTLFPIEQKHELDLSALNANGIFNPILPLFEEKDGVVLQQDLGAFLTQHSRSIQERRQELLATFPPPPVDPSSPKSKGASAAPVYGKLISSAEAQLVVTALHGAALLESFVEGIEYIEHLLYTQLTAAIGKIVTPLDFAEYMKFHQRKLFNFDHSPKGFSYPVRRPEHSPEGSVALEANTSDGKMSDAATEVKFMGDRFVHAWVNQTFSGVGGQSLQLVARARQFSSFILLAGRISSATLFDPKIAVIIKDKDDLKIPLLMETIPTPKEFADAIESLSPEQQRFCKAFRGMQLESTMLGVVVIQIKPQLEKLLNLPNDSLTKEIKLNQELLKLFIDFNIPSDLLSYAGRPEASTEAKLKTVEEYVEVMKKMIDEAKKAEEADVIQRAQARAAAEQNLILTSSLTQAGLVDDVVELQMERMEKSKSSLRRRKNEAPVSRSRRSAVAPSPAPAPSPSAPPGAASPVPAPPSEQPAPVDSKPSEPSEPKSEEPEVKGAASLDSEEVSFDFTQIPSALDAAFMELDPEAGLRPTILNFGAQWTKSFKKGLLSPSQTTTLANDDQLKEKNKAWDLLDALTRSGSLMVDEASLHVIIAATHTFTKSLIDTVVQDNINPVEKVERSLLIVASVLFKEEISALVNEDEIPRLQQQSGDLLGKK